MATVRYTVVDGEVLAEKRNGVRKEYVPDPLGSTVALLDSNQNQTDTFSYWPYGEVNVRTGSTSTPFQFVGTVGYYNDSSSKTYVRARHLDTQKGRWISQDPIGFAGGDWNLYRYGANRTTVEIDAMGMTVYKCCVFGPPAGLQHCFISTNRCGAWGFYPAGNMVCGPGQVNNDDGYLKEGKNGKGQPIHIPGVGDPDEDVKCIVISNDPAFEKAVCKCIEDSRKNPPPFVVPFYCCISWTTEMLQCACNSIKGLWGAFFGCYDGSKEDWPIYS